MLARCILEHDTERMNLLLGVVVKAVGGTDLEFKPGTVKAQPPPTAPTKKATELDRNDPAMMERARQREAKLAARLGAHGMKIHDA